jgi:hypothetical protein
MAKNNHKSLQDLNKTLQSIVPIVEESVKRIKSKASRCHSRFWDYFELELKRKNPPKMEIALKALNLGVTRKTLYEWINTPVGLRPENVEKIVALTGSPREIWLKGGDLNKRREAVWNWLRK